MPGSLVDTILMYCILFTGTVNIDGLGDVDMEGLFALPKEYWTEDIKEAFKFLEEQVVEHHIFVVFF